MKGPVQLVRSSVFVAGAISAGIINAVFSAGAIWLALQGYPLAWLLVPLTALVSGRMFFVAVVGGVDLSEQAVVIRGAFRTVRLEAAEARFVLDRSGGVGNPRPWLGTERSLVRLRGIATRHQHEPGRLETCYGCVDHRKNVEAVAAMLSVPIRVER